MKFAAGAAHPMMFVMHRCVLAVVVMFGVLVVQGKPLRPPSWTALLVTAVFQTTLNFGGTALALASGGAGRTSVLVFTMPFWTLLLAWPIFRERVRGAQWLAILLAMGGLFLLVDPTHWSGDLTPKLWALLSGFGWAAGTIAMKYFSRDEKIDLLNFVAWQMLVGAIPFFILPMAYEFPATHWSLTYLFALLYVSTISSALAFVLWIEVLRFLPAGTASLNMFAVPVLVLAFSSVIFGERLAGNEWAGIATIGAGLAVLMARGLRGQRE